MKKIITLLRMEGITLMGWIFVFLTILSLIGTLLTTNKFMQVKYFETYRAVQISMCLTMIAMSIKLFDVKSKDRNWFYSFLCLLIAVGTMLFMYIGIY